MRNIKKFNWGGGFPMQGNGSFTPFNSATSSYNSIMGLQANTFSQFSIANNPALKARAATGDLFSQSLISNSQTNTAIEQLNNMIPPSTQSKIVNPAASKGGLFSKASIGNTMNVAGGVASAIGSMIPQKEQSALTTGLNQGYDAAANAVSSIPGVGTIVGGAMKIGGMLSDGLTAIGVGTDQMTGVDKVLDSKFLKLTPMGLVNAFGAKKADTINKDNETWEQQGSAYGGSLAKVDDALTKSGKKYGTFSGRARRKANEQIGEAKRQQNLVADINSEAQDRFAASNYSGIGFRNQLALSGGYRNMSVGKQGMKILDRESQWAREVLAKRTADPVIEKFAEGGKVNVIPDGALHKNKHHLEEVVPELEEITAKGIPVISKEDGGEIIQHAEIERNEIIFHLEVTKKLEELMNKGTDEAAIEAGKLLVQEILNNTIDNTGLMEEIE